MSRQELISNAWKTHEEALAEAEKIFREAKDRAWESWLKTLEEVK